MYSSLTVLSRFCRQQMFKFNLSQIALFRNEFLVVPSVVMGYFIIFDRLLTNNNFTVACRRFGPKGHAEIAQTSY